jgi:hypothetical protein
MDRYLENHRVLRLFELFKELHVSIFDLTSLPNHGCSDIIDLVEQKRRREEQEVYM